jgi:hypothetical protein
MEVYKMTKPKPIKPNEVPSLGEILFSAYNSNIRGEQWAWMFLTQHEKDRWAATAAEFCKHAGEILKKMQEKN